jgi:hypothetical protein
MSMAVKHQALFTIPQVLVIIPRFASIATLAAARIGIPMGNGASSEWLQNNRAPPAHIVSLGTIFLHVESEDQGRAIGTGRRSSYIICLFESDPVSDKSRN